VQRQLTFTHPDLKLYERRPSRSRRAIENGPGFIDVHGAGDERVFPNLLVARGDGVEQRLILGTQDAMVCSVVVAGVWTVRARNSAKSSSETS
jgi:hypothetical protein